MIAHYASPPPCCTENKASSIHPLHTQRASGENEPATVATSSARPPGTCCSRSTRMPRLCSMKTRRYRVTITCTVLHIVRPGSGPRRERRPPRAHGHEGSRIKYAYTYTRYTLGPAGCRSGASIAQQSGAGARSLGLALAIGKN